MAVVDTISMFSLYTTLLIGLLLWIPLWPNRPVVIRVKRIRIPGLRIDPLGLSLFCFVFIRRDVQDPGVLAHEFAHFRQQRHFSPLGLSAFMAFDLLRLALQGKRGFALYQHLWTERDANSRMHHPIAHPWVEARLRPFRLSLQHPGSVSNP